MKFSFRKSLGVIVAVFIVSGLIMSLKAPDVLISKTTSGLSDKVQSSQVELIQKQYSKAKIQPAIVVYSEKNNALLTTSEITAITANYAGLKGTTHIPNMPLVFADNHKVAYGSVFVDVSKGETSTIEQVKNIRSQLKNLPSNIISNVTGGPAFTTDLAGVFSGANTRLLLITVIVVAILLIYNYRSPILWLIPLSVVGLAEQLTTKVVALIAPHLNIVIDGAASGITSVLVFGAGTDYALLLIARYREQLHLEDNRFKAMQVAWKRTFESIFASGLTVALSLSILLLSSIESTRSLGFSAAIGILFAMFFSLFVLPFALVIFGKWIFWPRVPALDKHDPSQNSSWGRLGKKIIIRPVPVLLAGVLILAVLATGVTKITVGLSENDTFRVKPEAVKGQIVLSSALPAGAIDPVIVIVSPNETDQAINAIKKVDNVASVNLDTVYGEKQSISVILSVAPSTKQSFQAIKDIRGELSSIGSNGIVGGGVAQSYDLAAANTRDEKVIMPIIILVVLIVLIILLRAIVAPLLLILTVLLTYLASLGASWYIFKYIYNFPALAAGVPLYAFIFLVALGVDYNIFLSTRAKEEAKKIGTRKGMLKALTVTGGVITSAGILLASVFAVLGVLPLIVLTQIGVIVGIGVLLDTLLVRTVLVPSLAFILGKKFWWANKSVKN